MSYVANLKTFVRVYELGSMSAAGRDQRISAAVASARIAELERHLGVRLFNRTTRSLQPTEQGAIFYQGAGKILDTIAEAEAAVAEVSQNPRGSLHVAAPLGLGKRLIAPARPRFQRPLPGDRRPPPPLRPPRRHHRRRRSTSPSISARSRISTLRRPADRRVPAPPGRRPCLPRDPSPAPHRRRSRSQRHACLLHRYPGAREFVWTLATPAGPQRFDVTGPLESDDGDVLTAWAIAGRGIILKPAFEIAEHLALGRARPGLRGHASPAGQPRLPLSRKTPAGPEEPPLHRLHGRRPQTRSRSHPRGPCRLTEPGHPRRPAGPGALSW